MGRSLASPAPICVLDGMPCHYHSTRGWAVNRGCKIRKRMADESVLHLAPGLLTLLARGWSRCSKLSVDSRVNAHCDEAGSHLQQWSGPLAALSLPGSHVRHQRTESHLMPVRQGPRWTETGVKPTHSRAGQPSTPVRPGNAGNGRVVAGNRGSQYLLGPGEDCAVLGAWILTSGASAF
jgi:hypothetical protein